MKVRLLEIHYRNIRDIKPEITVNLCEVSKKKNPFHVSLIQMPNGTGKTTTMDLLKYVFNGKAEDLSPEKIRSFKPHGSSIEEGEFRIKISIDDQIIYIRLILDYINEKAIYYTTKASTTHGGRQRGLKLPGALKLMLTERFVRLFVFDGELAKDLLDSSKTSAEEAIKSLYHLDTLFELSSNKVEDLIQHVQESQDARVKSDQGLKNLKTRRKTLFSIKEKLEETLDEFDEKERRLTKEINSINSKIGLAIEKNGELKEKKGKIDGEKLELDEKIKRNTLELLSQLRHPNNVSITIEGRIKLLSEEMITLKLPRATSIEFFNELAECDDCICGRPIGKKEKDEIKDSAQRFLSENEIGVLNAIKSTLRNMPQRDDVGTKIRKANELIKKQTLLRQEKDRIYKELSESGFKEIEELRHKLSELKEESNRYQDGILTITETDPRKQKGLGLTERDNLSLCNQRIGELDEKIAKATETLDFLNNANFFKKIIEEIIGKSETKYRKFLKNKANDKLNKILGNDDVKISEISKSILIKGKSGVSEGQTLAVAYSFISSLMGESQHQLPFIVDTPAAPLDLEVRREVAELIPPLFEQLVVFITSAERLYFADRFYSLKKNTQFITIAKESDGVCMNTDIEFFKKFQSEDE